jgi:hypothetical protein
MSVQLGMDYKRAIHDSEWAKKEETSCCCYHDQTDISAKGKRHLQASILASSSQLDLGENRRKMSWTNLRTVLVRRPCYEEVGDDF